VARTTLRRPRRSPAETVPDLDAPSPFDVASNRLLYERLMDLLTELPERERMVVSLR
jgi:RNA polymerase primary sigma factor